MILTGMFLHAGCSISAGQCILGSLKECHFLSPVKLKMFCFYLKHVRSLLHNFSCLY